MSPPTLQQQQQQHPAPDAFIYRRAAACGGLRAFPQLWQRGRSGAAGGAVGLSSSTAASLAAASSSGAAPASSLPPLSSVPGFIACPEAFLEVRAD